MRSSVGGEIGEAPPVADEASRFRGSAPIGGHDSARQSVGTTVGKRAPLLRKRNKNYGEVGRRGRRALQSSIGEWCVGDDAYIVPPLPAIKLSVGADASVRPPTTHRTSCDVSLRDQFANWSWQSVLQGPLPKGGSRPGDSAGRRTSGAVASLLSYLSYPIFRKKQGFPCEFFVIRATSAFFLLPNAPTCSKITLLTVLRVKLRSRSCAMDAHESCQAGNRAALRGIIHVPQGRRLCGFMGRTIYFR